MPDNELFYGECEACGGELKPVWFTDEEYEVVACIQCRTGRKRRACSHLVCNCCLRNYCVDDSFDGPWHY